MPTKKPCPGCGETDIYRRASSVCQQCQRDLKFAREAREDKRRGAEESRHRYYLPPEGWERAIKLSAHDAEPHIRGAVARMLARVARLLDEPLTPGTQYSIEDADPPYHNCVYKRDFSYNVTWHEHQFTDAAVAQLRALALAIESAIKSAYENGYKDGQGFVARLAKGEISIAELTSLQ